MVLFSESLLGLNTYVSSASEISTAMISAAPGDTLIMTNGLWVDQLVVFRGTGTESEPIVLTVESPGQVIMTGTSTLRISGSYLVADGLYVRNGHSSSGAVVEFRSSTSELASHCRLTNSAIVDYNPSSIGSDYKWVSVYGSYNRVDNCYFRGKEHSGTTLVVWFERTASPPAHYHRIDHNYFATRPDLGFNGGETIRIGTSDYSMNDSYTTVEWNYFEKCDGEIEIISNKSCENIYRYNTFFESQGTLTLRHGNRCTVAGNFFLGNDVSNTGGVRIIGEDHKVYNNYFQDLRGSGYRSAITLMNGVPDSPLNRYFQVRRAEVSHNTIIDCYQPFLIGAGADEELSLPPLDCTIGNNAVHAGNTYKIFNFEDDPINLSYLSNIVYGATLGVPDTTTGILATDPLYTLASDGLWRPASESPLIGAATDLYGYITDDMDGQARNGNFDIGADQVSDDPVIVYPVTAADVGPDWLNSGDSPVFLVTAVNGSGTIKVKPDTNIFAIGDTIIITATPDPDWTFLEWSGDLNGTANPKTFIISEDTYITAVFSPPVQYQIVHWIFGSGQIIYDPPGPDYDPGTAVEVTAIPADGWYFSEWGGELSGSQNPDTLIVNSDLAITASFLTNSSIADILLIPENLELLPNYPNPFNNSTRIAYFIPAAGLVTIRIYSAAGQEVFNHEMHQEPGHQYFDWLANDLPSGVYILKLSTGAAVQSQKLLLVK